MLDKIKLLFRYLNYQVVSRHSFGHGIHSPFLFNFIDNVLFVKEDNAKYSTIYEYLEFLKRSKIVVKLDDKGAGSRASNSTKHKISLIASNASTKKKFGKLLARMVAYFKPTCIIELGTSLGIGTSYLATELLPESRLYTIEGSENLLSFAQNNCYAFKSSNIIKLPGNFDEVLPELIKILDTVDFVYIDGNHRKEPTIRYFENLLPKLNNNSVLIFDDIHWSGEMEEAWTYIKSHQSVKVSLDLFQIGIVFFRKELLKEDFIVRF
jgi:predicted O-methyltransferase YrrM